MACKCSLITLSEGTLWGRLEIWSRIKQWTCLGARVWVGSWQGSWIQLSPVSGFHSQEQTWNEIRKGPGWRVNPPLTPVRYLGTQRKTMTWVLIWVVWVQALTTVVVSAWGLQATEKEMNQLLNTSFLFREEHNEVGLNWLSGQGLIVAREHGTILEILSLKTKNKDTVMLSGSYTVPEIAINPFCQKASKRGVSSLILFWHTLGSHGRLAELSLIPALLACNHCCLQLLCF